MSWHLIKRIKSGLYTFLHEIQNGDQQIFIKPSQTDSIIQQLEDRNRALELENDCLERALYDLQKEIRLHTRKNIRKSNRKKVRIWKDNHAKQ